MYWSGAVTFWYLLACMLYIGADPDCFLRLLEDGQKSKHFIRTVKLLQVTLIKQSDNI